MPKGKKQKLTDEQKSILDNFIRELDAGTFDALDTAEKIAISVEKFIDRVDDKPGVKQQKARATATAGKTPDNTSRLPEPPKKKTEAEEASVKLVEGRLYKSTDREGFVFEYAGKVKSGKNAGQDKFKIVKAPDDKLVGKVTSLNPSTLKATREKVAA